VKALIVGLGSIGTRHARNLAASGCELIGFDPSAERREQFERRFVGAAVRTSLENALEDRSDFAIVASPNRFHLPQAVMLARAGLHLLIEKPLAVDSNGVEQLCAEVAQRKLVAMIGSNWKFHPMLARMHELLGAGEIGRPLAAQALGGQYLPDWHPYEDYRQMYSSRSELGGGALLDSHDIDYISWLLGPIALVSCRTVTTGTLAIDTEDLVCMTLEFASGAVGTLQLDYLQHPYGRRIHLTGESGTLAWDVMQNELVHYSRADKTWRTWKPPVSYDLNEMYVAELDHFVRCVREGGVPATPLSQGIHVMGVIDAARRSAARSGAPERIAA
jgi:predicted dehydrogenase